VTKAVLAFDAGPGAGMGHQRRMQALATSLAALGATTELVPAEQPAKGDIVVVDSYRYRADDQDRFQGRVLVGVDDLGRDLAADVVVDPSPGATTVAHRAARQVLAGPMYALVDPDLAKLQVRPVGTDVDVVLVTTGGADDAGVGAAMAAELAGLLPGVLVRLAVGPWGSDAVPEGVEPIRAVDGLGPALAGADVVVTAGGVTLLEALVLARPTVAVVLADNQRPAAEGAAAASAVVLSDPAGAAAAAAALTGDAVRRQALAQAARTLVDGQGARRVAETVLALA
jgi:spore coat polysaccharide biosynthesis predicted glycosyltransferase SpsG